MMQKYVHAICLIIYSSNALACRGPFPAPITLEEAYAKAEAVFTGKVIKIEDGFPDDWQPGNPEKFEERKENLLRQKSKSFGRTVTFQPLEVWKGVEKATPVIFVEPAPQNTCEWDYDIEVNDHYILFAARDGNYFTFPPQMFDGRSHYTRYDPRYRASTDYQKTHYAEAMANEQKEYDITVSKLRELVKKAASAAASASSPAIVKQKAP